jgi:signal transduction histidine kinase
MITAALIVGAILLPLSGLVFFRIYENQLIRQTEGELIGQAAVLAASYQREIARAGPDVFPIGAPRPPETPIDPEGRYAPVLPALDLASSPILATRPDATFAPPVHPEAMRLGEAFEEIALAAQRTTLAGFRFLDANGVVIAGRAETGGSLANVLEVREALAGRFSSALRVRVRDAPPPLYSISRGATIRVFVAMPVFVDDRVRGVVYLSRTPDNIIRNMYGERARLLQAGLLILIAALLIGVLFVRAIARPVHGLLARAHDIARGDRAAIGPLPQHGTREIADLTQGFMDMAKRLFDRSDYLGAFATHVSHELKTPLAAIKGAAELVRDSGDDMSPAERERFLGNILADVERMSALLGRLRDLARAENPELGGEARMSAVAEQVRSAYENIDIAVDGDAIVLMSPENAAIVFGHLIDNARRHGAGRVSVHVRTEGGMTQVRVADDGEGVSAANRAQVFEPFFTTRRASGGTGMGLGIVRALMRAHGGDIVLAQSAQGAAFDLVFPARD